MSKTIDEVTQDELESLYLENDWDVKKIAEKTGWNKYAIGYKFASFYDTPEKRQDLIYRFKIVNSVVLRKLSTSIYNKRKSIIYYQIPLDELIESYKNNDSFKDIAKEYRTTEYTIIMYFNSQINTQEDYDNIKKEFNIKTFKEFEKKFPGFCKKGRKLGILSSVSVRDFSEFIGDIEKIRKYMVNDLGCNKPKELRKKDAAFYFNVWCNLSDEEKLYIFPNYQIPRKTIKYVLKFNSHYEAVEHYVVKNKIKNVDELFKSWPTLYTDYFLPLTPKEKELILPGCTSRSGWEKKMEVDLQKEFSDFTIIAQKRFDDCKNINLLPFDFALYSPTGKLIALIEVHGPSHFTEVYGNYKGVRKRDIIKYEYCKKNNIPLFYFTYEPSLVEKYGYPYFVYTDFEELVKAIRELLQKVS